MKFIKLITLLVFVAFIVNGCNKPRKRLLINSWSIRQVVNKTKVQKPCVFFPPCSYNYGIKFNKDNSYENFGVLPSTGTWELNRAESTIELVMDDANAAYKLPEKIKILSLTKDELFVNFTLNGFEYEGTFFSVE